MHISKPIPVSPNDRRTVTVTTAPRPPARRPITASSAPAAPPTPAEIAELRRPVTPEDIWRIEWRTQPKLRDDFSTAESYVAYQRGVAAGCITLPDEGR